MQFENWLDKTKELLKSTINGQVTLSHIANNAGVEVAWLSAFELGKIKNPGVKNLQKLHDYLQSLKG